MKLRYLMALFRFESKMEKINEECFVYSTKLF